jgi:O-antigen/teichoic acid export membrane protein
LLKKLFQNQVFRITSLNSVSVLIRILTGLVSTSVVAKLLGPTGVALLGNFRNFITSLETVAMLGFNNGIVKYVAEHHKDEKQLSQIISTVFFTLLGTTLFIALLLFGFSGSLNHWIFGSEYDFAIVFRVTALTLPLFALNVFLISIINGLSAFKKVIYLNIIGNLTGFTLSVVMIVYYQIIGALLAMAITPALLFPISWFWVSRSLQISQYINTNQIRFRVIKDLSAYSVMAFVSAFLLPLIYLKIRTNAFVEIGIENAGNWEAINRLSSFYMMFISTLLSVYFFPKLSQATSVVETRKVIGDYYKNVIPMFLAGGLLLYFCRGILISLIYSDKFLVLSDLFLYQLLGDFFKVCSLILGYQFFAKRMTSAYILTEVFSISLLYFLSNYYLQTLGVEGLVFAHFMTYLIYFCVLLITFRKLIFSGK